MTIRICDYCKEPMGNSWHTETASGELEVYVHYICLEGWKKRQGEKSNG